MKGERGQTASLVLPAVVALVAVAFYPLCAAVWLSLHRSILIFHDPGTGQPVERLTVSRYGLADLFAPAWDPAKQPDQWQAVADIVAARDPQKLAINTSDLTAFGDGMTLSQYQAMTAALPDTYRQRIVSGETLAVRVELAPLETAERRE